MPGIRRVVDWMPERDLLRAAHQGLTLDEIAELNYKKTGDRPTRSGISKMLKRLGAEPRQTFSGDLMPWKPIDMKHYQSPVRYMLHALSQWREKGEDSTPDTRRKVRELMEILDGSGETGYQRLRLVVDYDREKGWCFRPREETDEDVVRKPGPPPSLDEYLSRTPGLTAPQRRELAAYARKLQAASRSGKLAVHVAAKTPVDSDALKAVIPDAHVYEQVLKWLDEAKQPAGKQDERTA